MMDTRCVTVYDIGRITPERRSESSQCFEGKARDFVKTADRDTMGGGDFGEGTPRKNAIQNGRMASRQLLNGEIDRHTLKTADIQRFDHLYDTHSYRSSKYL
jgi:hypothetical protein